MLTAERHALLLDRLHADGRIVAKTIAAELGVSEDTVRRDLRDLAAAGLCQRVYGGALPASGAVADYATAAASTRAARNASPAPRRDSSCRGRP